MKRLIYDCAEYIIGTAREIKSLEKNLYWKTNFHPVFSEFPRFNMNRMYGIKILYDEYNHGEYVVISERDCCELLLGAVTQTDFTKEVA